MLQLEEKTVVAVEQEVEHDTADIVRRLERMEKELAGIKAAVQSLRQEKRTKQAGGQT